jgi:DNA-3-methyladenine glycosylase
MVLPISYYQNSDILFLAKDILGKKLVSNINGKITSGIIVETEAYKAPEDKGSHAYGNKRTSRTDVMFGAGGVAYVYLCYGIHHLFNIVSGKEGQAHAILLRAIEPLEGIQAMLDRRNMSKLSSSITNGPGKFTQAMGIRTNHGGTDLCKKQIIWIEEPEEKPHFQISSGPRIGIPYAEECIDWPWRFWIDGNRFVSQ